MLSHTVNASLIEFLHCSMGNAMIRHFVQNFLKGSNPALTYPFAKPPTSKGLQELAGKAEYFLLGGTLLVWPEASAKVTPCCCSYSNVQKFFFYRIT